MEGRGRGQCFSNYGNRGEYGQGGEVMVVAEVGEGGILEGERPVLQ